jgi:hypothetical protein
MPGEPVHMLTPAEWGPLCLICGVEIPVGPPFLQATWKEEEATCPDCLRILASGIPPVRRPPSNEFSITIHDGPTPLAILDGVAAALRGEPVPAGLAGHEAVQRAWWLHREGWPPAREVLAAARAWCAAQVATSIVPGLPDTPIHHRKCGAAGALQAAVAKADRLESEARAAADARWQEDADRMHRGEPMPRRPTYHEVLAQRDALLVAARMVLKECGLAVPMLPPGERGFGFGPAATAALALYAAVDACGKD